MPSVVSGVISTLAAAFEATAEAVENASVVLVTVDLAEFGLNPARSLYLSTREFVGPDGRRWDPILAENPVVDHGGNWLETGPQPVDAVFRVLDLRLSGQAIGEKFSDLLVAYSFPRSRVHIQQAFEGLTAVSEYRTLFDGTIETPEGASAEAIGFHCVQDRRWMQKCPPRVLTADDFPNASSDAIGTALPILLGDGLSRRYLENANTPDVLEATDAGIARGAIPLLVVDVPTGTGLEFPKALVSDRDIDSTGATVARWFMVEPELGRLAGPGTATLSNPAGGPAMLSLSSISTKVAIVPIEVDPATTDPADGMSEIVREDKPYNLEGRCELDFDAGKKNARWLMPDVAPRGKFVSADLFVYYAKNSWSGTAGDAIVENPALVTTTTQAFLSGPSTTFPSTGFQQVTEIPISGTVVRDWGDLKDLIIRISVRAAGQKLHVYRAVVRVTYQAGSKIERPGTNRSGARTGEKFNARGQRVKDDGNGAKVIERVRSTSSPDLLSFDHPLYGYFKGKLDDSLGTYTGTAGALIEHPVDMVRYLLREFGGVGAGAIVEDPARFGAFPNAKAALDGYKFLVHLTGREDLDRVVQEIGDQALVWFNRTPTTQGAPFAAVAWDVGASPDYRSATDVFRFDRLRNHVVKGSFRPGWTKPLGVINTLRANFDFDARTRTYGQQIYVTPTASRVWTGSAYGADAAREAEAADSAALYGEREFVMQLPYVVDPATATDILSRYFDLNVAVRVEVDFATWLGAYDLNRGHVIEFGSDWDSRFVYPSAGSDGSWEGKRFRVVRVKRPAGRPSHYMVKAVEV